MIDRITTAAFSFWWECNINHTAAVSHLTRALPALGQVNGHMNGTPLLQWIQQQLQHRNADIQRAAVRAVGQIMAQGVRLFRGSGGEVEGKWVEELAKL